MTRIIFSGNNFFQVCMDEAIDELARFAGLDKEVADL